MLGPKSSIRRKWHRIHIKVTQNAIRILKAPFLKDGICCSLAYPIRHICRARTLLLCWVEVTQSHLLSLMVRELNLASDSIIIGSVSCLCLVAKARANIVIDRGCQPKGSILTLLIQTKKSLLGYIRSAVGLRIVGRSWCDSLSLFWWQKPCFPLSLLIRAPFMLNGYPSFTVSEWSTSSFDL